MRTALRITGVIILDSDQSETALRDEVQTTAAAALMKLFSNEQAAIGNVGIQVEVDREATDNLDNKTGPPIHTVPDQG